MSEHQTLRVEIEGPIGTVTITRPEKRNALSSQVRTELFEAFGELSERDDLRVVVLTGEGDRAFVAGADLREFAARTVIEQEEAMSGPSVFDQIAGFPLPVIARINGYALGGGCELAMACDIRIASEHAKLGQPEINLAIIPGGGGTQRLPRLVGLGQAMKLILTGEIIDAAQAREIGLVDEVVAAERLDARVDEIARAIAEKSPIALRMAKSALRASQETSLSAGIDQETDRFLICFASKDKEEGIKAFFEKRKPEFRGE